ncbi:MAG TPA: SprT family protein [Bacillota bacterium]
MELLSVRQLNELVNEISVKHFHKPFHHEVYFNHRLRTTGGRYIPAKKVIELNPKYYMELGLDELIGIIKHELCHYHLHIEGKGYGHKDDDFKRLLKETGSPRHCKPLPSQKNKYNHMYVCQRCEQVYKRIRRVDVQRFRCGKCRGRLRTYK